MRNDVMPSKGMLLSTVDVDDQHDRDFNEWSDHEHLVERVSIPGFQDARRYAAVAAGAKYLSLYTTETFETLSSAEYRRALANQTPWSLRNIERFRNTNRVIARITASLGSVRGAFVTLIRIRPPGEMRPRLRDEILRVGADLVGSRQCLTIQLLEGDALLSRPLDAREAPPGADDWYIVVEANDVETASRLSSERIGSLVEPIASGTYRLLAFTSRSCLASPAADPRSA